MNPATCYSVPAAGCVWKEIGDVWSVTVRGSKDSTLHPLKLGEDEFLWIFMNLDPIYFKIHML